MTSSHQLLPGPCVLMAARSLPDVNCFSLWYQPGAWALSIEIVPTLALLNCYNFSSQILSGFKLLTWTALARPWGWHRPVKSLPLPAVLLCAGSIWPVWPGTTAGPYQDTTQTFQCESGPVCPSQQLSDSESLGGSLWDRVSWLAAPDLNCLPCPNLKVHFICLLLHSRNIVMKGCRAYGANLKSIHIGASACAVVSKLDSDGPLSGQTEASYSFSPLASEHDALLLG